MNMKRLFSLILSVLLLASLVLPTGAFAEDAAIENDDALLAEDTVDAVITEAVEYEQSYANNQSEEVLEDVSEQPADAAFQAGYAVVKAETVLWSDRSCQNSAGTLQEDAVVYLAEPTGENEYPSEADIIKLYANVNGEKAEFFLRYGDAQPMTEEETALYLANSLNAVNFETVVLTPIVFAMVQEETEPVSASAVSLTITTDPQDTTRAVGASVSFTVAAEGSGTLSYQWQYSINDGTNWYNSNASGSKTNTLRFTAAAANDGYLYRCVVKDSTGEVASKGAKLTISSLKITTDPQDTTRAVGASVSFTVAAEGSGTLSYQWQYRKKDGTNWYNSNASGSKTNTLRFKAAAANDGYLYRCVVKNGTLEATSKEALLTISSLKITTDPQDTTRAVGASVSFTVAAEGSGTLSYQWQYSIEHPAHHSRRGE